MRFLILLLACLTSWPAIALDLTVGETTNCTSWLHERDKLQSFIHSHSGGEIPKGTFVPGAWLIGFLEGYDTACPKAKPLAAGLDTDAVFERVDRICRSTKTDDTPLLLAAMELVKQLDPQHSDVCTN
ncbi:MAG TPA: hypothetical protein VNZ48_07135 [Xanthobacteraceae bacterium]|jgi:hypothetical protein|nr:hypothetical protein [Xanthobacteraceae bacterium]